MIKTIGWVLTLWGIYAGVSAYMSGDFTLAIVAFVMSMLIMFTNTGSRTKKAYTATLCVRDDDIIHQFIIGVATSLPSAGTLVKLEALARQTKEIQDSEFTTVDDYYVVQERIMNSASILREFDFTSRGNFISE